MSNSYNWSHRKLTDSQAAEVRKKFAEGNITKRQLAKEFNCGEMVIHRIIKGTYYKGLNPLEADYESLERQN